jgi:hypothetical protein
MENGTETLYLKLVLCENKDSGKELKPNMLKINKKSLKIPKA